MRLIFTAESAGIKPADFARILQINPATLWQWRTYGKLTPAITTKSGRVFYSPEQIAEAQKIKRPARSWRRA